MARLPFIQLKIDARTKDIGGNGASGDGVAHGCAGISSCGFHMVSM